MNIEKLIIDKSLDCLLDDIRNSLHFLGVSDADVNSVIVDYKFGQYSCHCSVFSEAFSHTLAEAYKSQWRDIYIDVSFEHPNLMSSFCYYFRTSICRFYLSEAYDEKKLIERFDSIQKSGDIFNDYLSEVTEKEYYTFLEHNAEKCWGKLTEKEKHELLEILVEILGESTTYKNKENNKQRKRNYLRAKKKILANPSIRKQVFDVIKSSDTSLVRWFGIISILRTLVFSAKNYDFKNDQ